MTTTNLGTVAHIRLEGINYRVEDHISDYLVCCADGTGYRWFSTHTTMMPRADIALALSSYFDQSVNQSQINFF